MKDIRETVFKTRLTKEASAEKGRTVEEEWVVVEIDYRNKKLELSNGIVAIWADFDQVEEIVATEGEWR